MKWGFKSQWPYCWHRWWAWMPVQVTYGINKCSLETRWVWLENVERIRKDSWGDFWWEYRELR